MNFELNDELLILQQTARRFADEEMIPIAAEHDVTGEFPREIMRKAWELGLTNTFIPEEYGGVGLSVLGACVNVEEISRGCSGMTTSLISNDLGLTPIIVGGSEEQKREWLTPCAEEFKILAFCLSEPGAGSDVGGSGAACNEGWRRLYPERNQGLDHEWRRSGRLYGLRDP